MVVMASPPPGYTVRPATWDDLDAVATLLRVADLADIGEQDFSIEELKDDWRQPQLDMTSDTWLVMSGAEACAYTWLLGRNSHRDLDSWGVVHPGHRGQGLGTFLLDVVERRAAEHQVLVEPPGQSTLLLHTLAMDSAARTLLEGRGFELTRHFWRMDIELETEPASPGPVDGISIRTFLRGQDERPVYEAFEEAFAGHFGYVPRSFEDWSTVRLQEGFVPSLWFVATEGQEVVGALAGRIMEGMGWVATLGVRQPWRGRGIGGALLRHSFAAFHRRGITKASLSVDARNETGAVALYERAGMHVALQYDTYEKRYGGPA
jgi:mycothiol synthase